MTYFLLCLWDVSGQGGADLNLGVLSGSRSVAGFRKTSGLQVSEFFFFLEDRIRIDSTRIRNPGFWV